MNNRTKLLSITLCLFSLLCSTSCQKQEPMPVPEPEEEVIEHTEPIASFDSVTEFKIAIKKDPTLYNGATVSVKGTVNKLLYQIWLFDDPPAKDELWDDRPRVKVSINSSVFIDDEDYIEVCGIVTATDDGISLENCTYTMITPYEEKE